MSWAPRERWLQGTAEGELSAQVVRIQAVFTTEGPHIHSYAVGTVAGNSPLLVGGTLNGQIFAPTGQPAAPTVGTGHTQGGDNKGNKARTLLTTSGVLLALGSAAGLVIARHRQRLLR